MIKTKQQEIQKSRTSMIINKRGFVITSVEELEIISGRIAKSRLAPKNYKDNPGDIFVAIMFGMELGLPPMQSLQNIAVVNGVPTVYGDAIPGLVLGSGLEEWNKIEQLSKKNPDGSYPNDFGFKYTSKRMGRDEPHSVSFTVADAKRAGLWGKPGTWTQYPKRMLLYRPRTFCCRDLYADVLKGIHTYEEMQDAQRTGYRTPNNISKSEYEVVEKTNSLPEEPVKIEPPEPQKKPKEDEESTTEKQVSAIYTQCNKSYNLKHDQAQKLASEIVCRKIDSMSELTKSEASHVIDTLNEPFKVKELQEKLNIIEAQSNLGL